MSSAPPGPAPSVGWPPCAGSTQRHPNPRLFFQRWQIAAIKCRETRVFRGRRLCCGAMLRNASFTADRENAAENGGSEPRANAKERGSINTQRQGWKADRGPGNRPPPCRSPPYHGEIWPSRRTGDWPPPQEALAGGRTPIWPAEGDYRKQTFQNSPGQRIFVLPVSLAKPASLEEFAISASSYAIYACVRAAPPGHFGWLARKFTAVYIFGFRSLTSVVAGPGRAPDSPKGNRRMAGEEGRLRVRTGTLGRSSSWRNWMIS